MHNIYSCVFLVWAFCVLRTACSIRCAVGAQKGLHRRNCGFGSFLLFWDVWEGLWASEPFMGHIWESALRAVLEWRRCSILSGAEQHESIPIQAISSLDVVFQDVGVYKLVFFNALWCELFTSRVFAGSGISISLGSIGLFSLFCILLTQFWPPAWTRLAAANKTSFNILIAC